MIRNLFFVARLAAAWFGLFLLLAMILSTMPVLHRLDDGPLVAVAVIVSIYAAIKGFAHLRRVRLIAGHVDATTRGNRQRRQIEVPFEVEETFELLEAAIRELPRVEDVESARDSLQVQAKVRRADQVKSLDIQGLDPNSWKYGLARNQIQATVDPGADGSRITLIFEPEMGAWSDWFCVDQGTNLENAEALSRAIARRMAEFRRGERAAAARTATEKELAVAKLSLLHAQVEPHFLYNTLASAQYLTRHDPPRADEMLGHLIEFLRRSLPRTEDALSTLGEELERSRAYLEILKLRMGPRLQLQIDVPDELRALTLPPMILQTLTENAIKHGLEPKPGGGSVWIRARAGDTGVSITVADDGMGLNTLNSGSGIGLRNVRERLRLVYGERAQLSIVANFPSGVAATIVVPAASGEESAHV